ncbi:lytic murein transglycosylase [Thalassobius sp. Cn5-15]|uniref:lytic murein transglycosylase n=1 Tax=Thalassobius sp. Cn5-15 TaxID=2917763 RepID=UPI001EF22127|nr:lytic murein transglycosylase [Thalassobius sp. Cn5-15]MCG7494123.1 lytic murein transglycosylase [Thalassobius sp. Cn5-15]
MMQFGAKLHRSIITTVALLVPATVSAMPVEVSLRPSARPPVAPVALAVASSAKEADFQRWIRGFQPRARAAGISDRTFNRAFRSVTFDPDVIKRDRNQSEFTKSIWDYLDSAASDKRVKNGRAALRDHRRVLDQIEQRYGVDKEVVTAVWGLESAYGEYRGNHNIIRALATLAYDGRRGRFFEQQLIAALKILQTGDTTPANLRGSWAGAMGHTQFIPTSYQAFAVDFTGDGRRDIWSDNPADALASTAAYLKKHGWVSGQPWGVEVQLPRGFNYALASRKITKSPSDWARLGVRDMQGRKVRDYGSASILLPAGHRGAAFMIFKNFKVISRYNLSTSYVIGVGHLSDRLKGSGPIAADWPRNDRTLKFAERKEMQSLLTRKGFSTGGVDGRVGPMTQRAIRAYQSSRGIVPDGFASLRLLQTLRK